MRAALRFVRELAALDQFGDAITVDLYGSLALTGVGHGTDRAVRMGLLEQSPDTVDLEHIDDLLAALARTCELNLLGKHAVNFDPVHDVRFHRTIARAAELQMMKNFAAEFGRSNVRANIVVVLRVNLPGFCAE